MKFSRLAATYVLIVFGLGCNDAAQLKLYPVSGRVLVKGKPAAGAELAFYGLDEHLQSAEAPFPKAVVQEDGSFTMSSYAPGDGAPAGNYVVTITWRRSRSLDPELRDASPDVLRGRYATPDKSKITVEVKPEENSLADIELK